jgi:hypothetical protein
VCIGAEASQQEQVELLAFLEKNSNIFAWSTFDLVGVSRDVIEHRLEVAYPQWLANMVMERKKNGKW